MEYPELNEYYIGVDGKWNFLMVYTPNKKDLGGSLAYKKDLDRFYDVEEELKRKVIDTLE